MMTRIDASAGRSCSATSGTRTERGRSEASTTERNGGTNAPLSSERSESGECNGYEVSE